MAVRVATVSVLAALTVLMLAGTGYAQQNQGCAARLGVCHDDAINDRGACTTDCFDERQAALERCERHPSPICALIGPLYARCQLRCAAELQRDFFLCFFRFRACIDGRQCENSPTATRTVTRTQTPTFTPGGIDPGPPVVGVATPTATPPPPR